MSLLQSSSTNY